MALLHYKWISSCHLEVEIVTTWLQFFKLYSVFYLYILDIIFEEKKFASQTGVTAYENIS